MDTNSKDCLKQLDTLLAERNQSWLFGAGISLGTGTRGQATQIEFEYEFQ